MGPPTWDPSMKLVNRLLGPLSGPCVPCRAVPSIACSIDDEDAFVSLFLLVIIMLFNFQSFNIHGIFLHQRNNYLSLDRILEKSSSFPAYNHTRS